MSPTIKNYIDFCKVCGKRVPMTITKDGKYMVWTCQICKNPKVFNYFGEQEYPR